MSSSSLFCRRRELPVFVGMSNARKVNPSRILKMVDQVQRRNSAGLPPTSMSASSGSHTSPNVKYKTYQSAKRSSTSSAHSLSASPSEHPSPLAAPNHTRTLSFTRPSLGQTPSPKPSSSTKAPSPQPGPSQSHQQLWGSAALTQTNTPSPLSRVNPSTNDLDRFPRSPPPPASPSHRPLVANAQLAPSPRAQQISLPQRDSRPSSSNSAASSSRTLHKAPYLAGFQAKGATRLRTEDFFQARQSGTEAKRLEHARLQRRLEKVGRMGFRCHQSVQAHNWLHVKSSWIYTSRIHLTSRPTSPTQTKRPPKAIQPTSLPTPFDRSPPRQSCGRPSAGRSKAQHCGRLKTSGTLNSALSIGQTTGTPTCVCSAASRSA